MSKPRRRTGGRPPSDDLNGVAPVRLTIYLRPEQVRLLRCEVYHRHEQGMKADVSMVMREAVDVWKEKTFERQK